jgi:hypothetical protein
MVLNGGLVMRKKIEIGMLLVSMFIPLACYAHAGMYDRYLDKMVCVKAVQNTIFVSQIVIFILIRFNWLKSSKHIRMRLLLLAKKLYMKWWKNVLAAWVLSSFVLTSYLYVFCSALWLIGIIPLFLFWCFYSFVVLRKRMRERLLSGMKALYFYLIASTGQIIGLSVYYFAYLLKWYSPYPYYEYTGFLWDFLGYKTYIGDEGGYFLIKGMLELAICMAIPYFVLVFMKAIKYIIYRAR